MRECDRNIKEMEERLERADDILAAMDVITRELRQGLFIIKKEIGYNEQNSSTTTDSL